jgi:hypothetical protein
MAWLHNVRRLRVRCERIAIAHRQPRVLEWPLVMRTVRGHARFGFYCSRDIYFQEFAQSEVKWCKAAEPQELNCIRREKYGHLR